MKHIALFIFIAFVAAPILAAFWLVAPSPLWAFLASAIAVALSIFAACVIDEATSL